jgi:hypothetical protein
MLRATAAPERFLATGGFARFVSRAGVPRRAKPHGAIDLGVVLPSDLRSFLGALSGGSIAGLVARLAPPKLSRSITSTRGQVRGRSLSHLVALLAGAVPFAETADGDVLVYFLADEPARGVIASLEPRRFEPTLVCRGAAALAVECVVHVLGEEAPIQGETTAEPKSPKKELGIAETGAVGALLDRARALLALLHGSDPQVRAAARSLAIKPLDVPAPAYPTGQRKPEERTAPLALGPLVEAFFRLEDDELAPLLAAHADSPDAIVREASTLLGSALGVRAGKTKRARALASDLARRRDVALRALARARPAPPARASLEVTRQIIARYDELPLNAESYAALHEREETLLALSELGDRAVAPELVERALSGDAAAVDMLAALGDRSLVPRIERLLGGGPSRARQLEAAIARMAATLDAEEARPALRALLAANPMTNWREGLERGVLVRELVVALGELRDEPSAKLLVEILESKSQEYRAVLPSAAHALGRLRHAPAFGALERLLVSPNQPVTCEALWAVGEIGRAHADLRDAAANVLERLTGLEPGAEVTRLTALAKVRDAKSAPRAADLRRAIDRALWEPAFRQEETLRRRAWALRALEELAGIAPSLRLDPSSFFLGHEAIRYFVTRDDHRVRKAAEAAFAAWGLPVPEVRRYFAFALPELEQRGGLDALLEAVKDPLGVFRHNVATRLAAIGDPRAVRSLAEATARLFAEPPTSTYEYDDAPPYLGAFVRALARLNGREGNDVLIEGLRSNNHQVRAVVAENAPDDERLVPELMAMLGDPRSFLRSRAEKSLRSLGAIAPPPEPATTEIAVTARIVER